MPREPPYFDIPYHSTDLNLEIGTGVTVIPAQITKPYRKNQGTYTVIFILFYPIFNNNSSYIAD